MIGQKIVVSIGPGSIIYFYIKIETRVASADPSIKEWEAQEFWRSFICWKLWIAFIKFTVTIQVPILLTAGILKKNSEIYSEGAKLKRSHWNAMMDRGW